MKASLLVILFALTGCGTLAPTRVDSQAASFDGNNQDSGIIQATASGYVVTPHFRDRYSSLVALYGRDFLPTIKDGDGITQLSKNEWLIDRQHLVQFLEMNAWLRAGLKPKNP
jgi:hypothetical protein